MLGLAVPDPPAQALDFRDNHSLCFDLLRSLGRQGAGCLLGMVQPQGDVKPLERRRRRDAGLDQHGAQPGTAIGKGSQLGVGGVPDGDEAAPDQRLDRSVGPGDRGEHLAGSIGRLDVAKADFQVTLAVLTAPDKSRV